VIVTAVPTVGWPLICTSEDFVKFPLILTVSVAVLLLPALSDTEHDTACVPWPDTETVYEPAEPDTVTGLLSTVQVGVPASPLVASDAETFTVTGELVFQPFDPSAVWVTEIDGLTVSILTESVAVLLLPALSDTEHDTACVPWPETETVYEPAEPDTVTGLLSTVQVGVPASPLVASDAETFTVTGVFVFQPLEPVAVCDAEIDGLAVSILTESLAEFELPALSLTEQETGCVPWPDTETV
jgi:hypothetical protein